MLLLLLISTVTLVVSDGSHFEDQGYKVEPLSTDSAGSYPNEAAKLGMEVDDNGFIKSPGAEPRWIGGGVVIGSGAMVHHTAHIYGGAVISENCIIGALAVVGGGSVIGPNAIMGPGARCEGGAVIGHHAILGPNAILGGGQMLPPYQVRL